MIDKTMWESKPNTKPEMTLDTILFNATTIARDHIKSSKRGKREEENYSITEMKTTKAQIEYMDLYGPSTPKKT